MNLYAILDPPTGYDVAICNLVFIDNNGECYYQSEDGTLIKTNKQAIDEAIEYGHVLAWYTHNDYIKPSHKKLVLVSIGREISEELERLRYLICSNLDQNINSHKVIHLPNSMLSIIVPKDEIMKWKDDYSRLLAHEAIKEDNVELAKLLSRISCTNDVVEAAIWHLVPEKHSYLIHKSSGRRKFPKNSSTIYQLVSLWENKIDKIKGLYEHH